MKVFFDAVSWDAEMTKRYRYQDNPLTTKCTMLRYLAGIIQWVDVEEEFGRRTSHLSEVFWEVDGRFIDF